MIRITRILKFEHLLIRPAFKKYSKLRHIRMYSTTWRQPGQQKHYSLDLQLITLMSIPCIQFAYLKSAVNFTGLPVI